MKVTLIGGPFDGAETNLPPEATTYTQTSLEGTSHVYGLKTYLGWQGMKSEAYFAHSTLDEMNFQRLIKQREAD